MSLANVLQPLRAGWRQFAPRDKNLVRLAVVLVLGLLVWQWSLKPAITTLRTAEAQARVLENQLQQMRAAQAQAQAQTLQKQPALDFEEAARRLTAATQQTLGATAQLSMVGERASVTLKNATPDALAEWLSQARINARSVPLEAKLVRSSAPTGITWSGVVMMSLPPR